MTHAEIIAAYVDGARKFRADDWAVFVAEAKAEPFEITCEVSDVARDAGVEIDWGSDEFYALSVSVREWLSTLV